MFAHYKELEKVGLAAPQVTYMMHALVEKGIPVDVEATTIQEAAEEIKEIIIATPMPDDISTMILEAYNQLSMKVGEDEADVAVRSSATA